MSNLTKHVYTVTVDGVAHASVGIRDQYMNRVDIVGKAIEILIQELACKGNVLNQDRAIRVEHERRPIEPAANSY